MGCYNETCVLTGLPIQDDEETAIFPVIENEFVDDSYCYPTAFYKLYPYHFFGTYNSYGAFENCYGDGIKPFIDSLISRLHELSNGPNECHDIPINKSDLDYHVEGVDKVLSYIFNAKHEGRLFIKLGRQLKVTFFYIKKSAYDDIINNYTKQHYNPTVKHSYEYLTLIEYIKKKYDMVGHHLVGNINNMFDDIDNHLFGFDGELQAKHFFRKITADYLLETPLIYNALKTYWINRFFEQINGMWIERSYGSQVVSIPEFKFIHNYIGKQIEQYEKQFNGDDE